VSYAGFDQEQIDTVRELLAYYEDTIWWGQDWDNPKDAMHFQMGYNTYRNQHTQDFIDRKIRSDGFSFFHKSDDTRIDRKPVVPGSGGTNWADVSQYQGRPVDSTYPHSIFCFRTNSGDQEDELVGENAAAALKGLEANRASIVMPYYFFKPGEANCDLHREVLQDSGLWLHPHTVTMVDVESAGGTIVGDQSTEVNDEVNRIRGWYGDMRRVCGYFNPNADGSLWVRRPYGLPLIIPQYNGRPGDLTAVRDEVVRREAFAHQWTDKATDVPPWSGQPVDLNWSPYSIAELAALFGMEEEIKKPDTAGPLDLSAADIEELCGAIASQFI
jgi:hypothetical protein